MKEKKTFFTILISLSLGGVIFLCSSFITKNAEASNQLKLISDDGLGSDFKIIENNVDLNEMITADTLNRIQKVKGIKDVYAVKSYIGELQLNADELYWKEYFDYLNDAYKKVFNGFSTQTENGGYAIKSNFLGYDDKLLKKMEPYILEGAIDTNQLRRNNEIVLVTLEDAQGNHDCIAKKVGDSITLKVPKTIRGTAEDLKLSGDPNNYEEKEFTIAAIVSRTMVRDSKLYTIQEAPDITFSVVMTNDQMEENFGIEEYRVLSIEKNKGADTQDVVEKITNCIADLELCLFQDYTGSIERQNEYLSQKALFAYGISVIFLIISLFHIMNTMNHLILSRKHEFGILRAMEITNKNFIKMMLRQGVLYGLLASAVMMVFYIFSNRVAVYLMTHVYGFLVSDLRISPILFISTMVINIFVGIIAVLVPAKSIIKENIMKQINLH